MTRLLDSNTCRDPNVVHEELVHRLGRSQDKSRTARTRRHIALPMGVSRGLGHGGCGWHRQNKGMRGTRRRGAGGSLGAETTRDTDGRGRAFAAVVGGARSSYSGYRTSTLYASPGGGGRPRSGVACARSSVRPSAAAL